MSSEFIDSQSKTYAEYDIKKVILVQAQNFSKAVGEWYLGSKSDHIKNKKNVYINYYDLYFNLGTSDILSKMKKEERDLVIKSYYSLNFDKVTARQLVVIIQKALHKFGLSDISNSNNLEV